MLSDFERKLHRILYNTGKYGKTPTMEQLETWTGRSEDDIRDTTKILIDKDLIRISDGEMEVLYGD